ncbi:MAG: RDD family protein [Candidatus Eremiobacteraeota bacterium]|nr:RDD family protein [Candidatus Eremiobacteraeota bacterium]
MERSISVRTPESIAFSYELAGLGSRFLARAIDFVIQILVLLTALIIGGLSSQRVSDLSNALHLSPKNLTSIIVAFTIIFIFCLFYVYFIVFEMVWHGQTPGKRILGIRVVADGGYPVTFMDSVIRNLVRVPEELLGYTLSVASVLLSSQNKRLGDFAAGTIVVRDSAFEVIHPQRWLRQRDKTLTAAFGAGALTSAEMALVERYVERRTVLAPQAARDAAAKIAAALRPKLDERANGLSDEELLVRLAMRSET